VAQIKKSLLEEPELREDFILRMRDLTSKNQYRYQTSERDMAWSSVYKLAVKESLDKKFKKLQKSDKEMLRLIERKVQDIL